MGKLKVAIILKNFTTEALQTAYISQPAFDICCYNQIALNYKFFMCYRELYGTYVQQIATCIASFPIQHQCQCSNVSSTYLVARVLYYMFGEDYLCRNNFHDIIFEVHLYPLYGVYPDESKT